MNNIQEALLERRSVYPRQFSGEEIPKDALLTAFEAANWAPTHKKTQPWRFKIFTGESKNELINHWVQMAERNALIKNEPWDETKSQKFDIMRQSSAVIAIVCHYTGMVPEVEETCSTAMAVQNFWLSLQSQGYAGYWSSGNGAFSQEIHTYLGLSENEKCLGYFMAGVNNGPLIPSFRKPVDELLEWRSGDGEG